MSLKDKVKWDHKYDVPEYITGKEPVEWLKKNSYMLSGKGSALDIASGEGRNAVFAAEKGYKTLAVDIDNWEIKKNSFDLILCFNFLDRRIFSAIKSGLKPGGLIFYETFTVDYLKYSNFKREWVLEYNELLNAFSELRILGYREVDANDKSFASLIALK